MLSRLDSQGVARGCATGSVTVNVARSKRRKIGICWYAEYDLRAIRGLLTTTKRSHDVSYTVSYRYLSFRNYRAGIVQSVKILSQYAE